MGVRKICSTLGCGKVHAGVILLGLSNSGKTSCLNVLRHQPAQMVVPTVGYSIEDFETKGAKIRAVDLSGASKYTSLWVHYYKEVQGVVFVVDAADTASFPEAKERLAEVLAHNDMKGRPLMVLANKQDLPHAAKPGEVAKGLGLEDQEIVRGREYAILGCSAIRGTGIHEGLSWLLTRLN